MAKFNPPTSFPFDKPTEWPDWKQRFERYRIATKLHKDEGQVQVSCLIYAMGNEAENIYKSLTFAADESRDDFAVVMRKFDEYFFPQRNTIHERACFHQRVQRPGETAESFIRALYDLSEHCEFGACKEENIRDRIVVGIRDKDLSRRLQLMKDLTLAQTTQIVRQSEEVAAQVSLQGDAGGSVQEVRDKRKSMDWKSQQQRGRLPAEKKWAGRDKKCGKCGKTQHARDERCPAAKSVCHGCRKIGHWARVCRNTRSVNEVTETEKSEQASYFLGSVCNAKGNSEAWTVQLLLDSAPIEFKIDTGADVTIINEDTFHTLAHKRTLEPSNLPLDSPGGELLCLGYLKATISYKGKDYLSKVYVVRGHRVSNLLSRSLSVQMNLVRRIDEATITPTRNQPLYGEHGTLKTEPVKIQLRDDAVPYAVHTARRVPFPMLQKVKEELQRMENHGVIERVTQPTEWCAPMVPVLKKNTAKARICVDLTKLNKSVKRERYILPTPEETMSRLSGATVFSSLDAASGFWQIPLHHESCKLTTFITPFGRYCFKRLPFGITSAPEIFQRKMLETLEGLEGVEVFMDDILVYGATMEQHDTRLEKVLQRIELAGLKLNREKCSFRQSQLRFLGHLIDYSGVRPDPEKVNAILQLPSPENVQELKRILGMVNYLGRYIPALATSMPATQAAFENIKRALTSAPVLAFYDVNRLTAVSADASSYGLGAVLLQLHGAEWKPVAYCSRRLTEAETRYAQIEKECLASVWACEKFDKYLCGLDRFRLETDHRPLVPLVNSRDLDNVPLRCQRLLMRLMRYKPEAVYVPGKTLVIADTLSRSPQTRAEDDTSTHSEVDCYIATVLQGIPASPSRMESIKAATATDVELQTVITYIRRGWPAYGASVPLNIKAYMKVKNELSEADGLVIRGCRIVIPKSQRTAILHKLHEGHQGLTKCRDRANSSVWWPGLSTELKNAVLQCHTCLAQRPTQTREPLISTPLPDRPWQRIALDLCEHNRNNYLVVSDYYSRFLEILHLPSTTSGQVVQKLKSTFARFGIPDEVVSDNGPQFSSSEFQAFAREMDFAHITSSPHHPQGNGHAERAVQTAKKILRHR
ncbi:uncharacterized protein K02A2.6-like [Haplochromis burtoni]|uniref:uncharacterized protein K02A2.6-like n=1 Tax=Haplochromis burtoni TaxID=8153 RepID=UPI001C2D0182|nr:uncharacterized protein K02A2.6-like [Haplochromis burtoni]